MKKSDKKTEQLIVSTLHALCEEALERHQGFRWLTHHVDYRRFPASLEVFLIFDNAEHALRQGAALQQAAQQSLATQSINIPLSRVHAMDEDAYHARFRLH